VYHNENFDEILMFNIFKNASKLFLNVYVNVFKDGKFGMVLKNF